jgi:hypothetical protein
MACDAHFAAHRFVPQVRLELGSNEAIKQAVAGGMGIAVVSRHALAQRPSDESLAVLDVAGFPIHASWFIVRLRGKRLSPIAEVFRSHLIEQARELGAIGAIGAGGPAGGVPKPRRLDPRRDGSSTSRGAGSRKIPPVK